MSSTSPYRAQTLSVTALDAALREQMCELYLRHFDGTSAALFFSDLVEKDRVVLMFHEGTLVGFSTFKFYEMPWQGKNVRVAFSGDTIVDRMHWGHHALNFGCISELARVRADAPGMPMYWLLPVKGHRTYKYMTVFVKRFFPHWLNTTPDLQDLAYRLAEARFGACFDKATGVVRFPESHGHLKADIAEASESELHKPGVRFFLQKNPGYRQGNELVCLCELDTDNLKPMAARIFAAATALRHV